MDEHIEVRQNLATPWLRTKFTLASDTLIGEIPNTAFGLIKTGKRKINQPLRSITNVSVETRFNIRRLVTAVLALFSGVLIVADTPILGVFLLLLGALMAVHVYTVEFVVRDASGADQNAEVSVRDRQVVRDFAEIVNRAVVNSTQDQRRRDADASSEGTDPVAQLERLKGLLDSNAITQEEYDDQKRRILRNGS